MSYYTNLVVVKGGKVLSHRDGFAHQFIERFVDDKLTKVFMEPYSKLTTASLPRILQDIFTTANINITATISDLDTLILTSDNKFYITDMSYNMKLITGFYSLKQNNYPIASQQYTEEYIIEPVIKPVTAFTVQDLNIKQNDSRPILSHHLMHMVIIYSYQLKIKNTYK